MFFLPFQHPGEQRQIIPQMPSQEKILTNEFSCGISHSLHGIPMMQKITHPVGGSFRSVDEKDDSRRVDLEYHTRSHFSDRLNLPMLDT